MRDKRRRARLQILLKCKMWIHKLSLSSVYHLVSPKEQTENEIPKQNVIIKCHLFEPNLFCVYAVCLASCLLVCLGLFYHVCHAPPWRIFSQYDSLTSNAWKTSCSLCQKRPDVSWTTVCVFYMNAIERKGRRQQMKLSHITNHRDQANVEAGYLCTLKMFENGSTTPMRTTAL